jgi:thiol-disulfide isomerase/thioredoxin
MLRVLGCVLLVLCGGLQAALIKEVRDAIAEDQFTKGEALIAAYRKTNGVTSEMLEALSWMGRGAVKLRQYAKAEAYAQQTHELVLGELKKHPLDVDANLPIALGAAIEVQALVMAGRNERDQAVTFLQRELQKYRGTSIRTRLQKNIHLLSLEGKPAPAIQFQQYLGPKPMPIAALKGKPVVLFFWAHWCGDCKYQGPILAKLRDEYKGLVVIGPTRLYGYVAGGEDAQAAVEVKYIDEVRKRHYSMLLDMPSPLDLETFQNYGSSTTPTLVIIDKAGIVRKYHPGVMTEAALRAELDKVER